MCSPATQVPAGKLLMMLDDVQARARLATAESGVKTAQAAVDAATHNGTLEQQQATRPRSIATAWIATRRSTIWTR